MGCHPSKMPREYPVFLLHVASLKASKTEIFRTDRPSHATEAHLFPQARKAVGYYTLLLKKDGEEICWIDFKGPKDHKYADLTFLPGRGSFDRETGVRGDRIEIQFSQSEYNEEQSMGWAADELSLR